MSFNILCMGEFPDSGEEVGEILSKVDPSATLHFYEYIDDEQAQVEHLTQHNLILIDLDNFMITGKHMISYVKKHSKLKDIPIVVLTHNTVSNVVRELFENGVSAIAPKPLTRSENRRVFVDTFLFWRNLPQ